MLSYRFDVIFIPQKVYLDWFWESTYTLYTPLPLATPLEPTPHTLSVKELLSDSAARIFPTMFYILYAYSVSIGRHAKTTKKFLERSFLNGSAWYLARR